MEKDEYSPDAKLLENRLKQLEDNINKNASDHANQIEILQDKIKAQEEIFAKQMLSEKRIKDLENKFKDVEKKFDDLEKKSNFLER